MTQDNHLAGNRLDLTSLRQAYHSGVTPREVVSQIYSRLEASDIHPVWITLAAREDALAQAQNLEQMAPDALPLYGVPFAVKDNMDVAGMATTAACPAFSFVADATATVVQKLLDAGAVLIGKTNMDQFATGLVGTRSPYGACSSVFDKHYISGGSSSGSAVAVAQGLVTFALGTDTAGSGRVPAAFNNIIGLKPTRGCLSANGVVPACRSLDCVSVFALTCGDAWQVLQAARGFDAADPYSRPSAAEDAPAPWLNGAFSFGVPRQHQQEFFGDAEAGQLYQRAIDALQSLGGAAVEFDYQPFREAAALLYAGPWVAERLAAIQPFFADHAGDMHPIVRGIIAGGADYSAVDAYQAQSRLQALRRQTAKVWEQVDVLLLPTTGTIYTHEQVQADPIRLNTNLGYYTNFVNLLDLAAVAVPAGFRANGLPFGVSLVGAAQTERALLGLADRFHRSRRETVGGTHIPLGQTAPMPSLTTPPGCTLVAVVGAHLTGQPLNHQLAERGAKLAFSAQTAPDYRLYHLQNTVPAKPGLVCEPGFAGPGIALEVWAMPTRRLGEFVAEIPAPLGIGSVRLSDGRVVKGFICEPFAVAGSADITRFGGWRAYLASL